ncbi:hypothetical protein CAMRE0001_2496 [Campylobacter rectus RM3267]|uniref:Uncharacterized protein n=1 Tax=Campylobacter rectus RM3267 TaxID=553218 RepID=B9D5D2_CAMRE|nr:hypothetical protein CAMRE0001_2496 [Campylobacter rectus RM3267]
MPPQNLKFKDVFRRANTAQLRLAREIYAVCITAANLN